MRRTSLLLKQFDISKFVSSFANTYGGVIILGIKDLEGEHPNWSANNKIWKYQLLVSSENVPTWSNVSVKHTASQDNPYVRVENDSEMDDFEIIYNPDKPNSSKQKYIRVIRNKI